MDATRILKNSHGIALIYLVILLFVMVGFAALVVDLGYMYVNKSKLQNAADAGALAAAGRIKIPDVFANMSARQNAKRFAALNDASLNLNLNATSNDGSGDIVLGVFDPTVTNKFTAVPVMGTYSSINAVKVVTRRNADTGTGINTSQKYDMFLGKIFGWDKMGTKASAIAFRPPRARTYFLIGQSVCSATPSPSSSNPFILTPQVPSQNMAWTSLDTTNTPASYIQDQLFCPAEAIPFIEVCGKSLYTSNAVTSSIFKSVEVDFYDPNYDTNMKTFAYDSHGNRYVSSWDVIVPVTESTNPTNPTTPYVIWGYAELTLSRVCGSGGGNPCNAQNRLFNAPNPNWVPVLARCLSGANEIVISKIRCLSCSSRFSLIGAKPVLAE